MSLDWEHAARTVARLRQADPWQEHDRFMARLPQWVVDLMNNLAAEYAVPPFDDPNAVGRLIEQRIFTDPAYAEAKAVLLIAYGEAMAEDLGLP